MATLSPMWAWPGYPVQGKKASSMTYNAGLGYWEAVGVPTIGYDDKGKFNPYPMAKLTATVAGKAVATASIVLSVSDELSCGACHSSGSDPAAEPAGGWVNNPDPTKDMKFNILKKHDARWNISGYLAQLASNGYTYQSSLYQTAASGNSRAVRRLSQ